MLKRFLLNNLNENTPPYIVFSIGSSSLLHFSSGNKLYQRLRVSGKARIEDREVYLVEAVPESGNPEKLYFDAETRLLSRRDVVYGKTSAQHYYEDYREVDGIKLPFVLRSEGPVRVITRLTEIKHCVLIDDAKFKRPTDN